MKKKKTASTSTATAADPKAERTPIRIPLPVEPDELPLTLTRPPLPSDMDNKTCSMLEATNLGSVGGGSGAAVGLIPRDVARVEGASKRAPGPDASDPRIVH